jgi:1-aminocyclopropane-1-carboxylate deaminase/D-cysteine desulfhydrase-like pyridoxal-dependent ACC family enzyme
MIATRMREADAFVMVPGGATPVGALGFVSAALELAQQVDDSVMPAPDTVLVGVGSTCTSAGLLVGMHAARALGRGWKTVPRLVSARVTPWPITSVSRIVTLARRVAVLLAELTGDPRMSFSSASSRRASRSTAAASVAATALDAGWDRRDPRLP